MDRKMLYERYLDDLELYFNYKRELNEKVKKMWTEDSEMGLSPNDPEEVFWREYETLDTLRELSMRAFDQYISMTDIEES